MEDHNFIKQNFRCPICLLTVDDPWETTCCGNLFCEKCTNQINNVPCVLCRAKTVKFRKNNFAKILMTKFETVCPHGCEKMIKYDKLKIHKYECNNAVFKCSMNECKWEGLRELALDHLTKEHSDIIVMVSENYKTLKPIFDTFDAIPKLMKESEIDEQIVKLSWLEDKNNEILNAQSKS